MSSGPEGIDNRRSSSSQQGSSKTKLLNDLSSPTNGKLVRGGRKWTHVNRRTRQPYKQRRATAKSKALLCGQEVSRHRGLNDSIRWLVKSTRVSLRPRERMPQSRPQHNKSRRTFEAGNRWRQTKVNVIVRVDEPDCIFVKDRSQQGRRILDKGAEEMEDVEELSSLEMIWREQLQVEQSQGAGEGDEHMKDLLEIKHPPSPELQSDLISRSYIGL
ncbi:hypothetical protein D8B26_007319 [Coccidioides posadasii str. Silveira]|uniref:Uncharacterized protein n=2 Tax=Coccidioides posadasii TaxID=199306 RepID=E9D3F8_COCPS|nr:conserved hypothetical protein [Coccidioides posadasii str. Silveira]KMM71502.1 hypothetical protein CPAG_07808 [Coccidioides posadasii RMSCC 3488]QVM12701.1 hypothetical protein D8B26_007319 [Coccidioides posadasii str. Silveira]